VRRKRKKTAGIVRCQGADECAEQIQYPLAFGEKFCPSIGHFARLFEKLRKGNSWYFRVGWQLHAAITTIAATTPTLVAREHSAAPERNLKFRYANVTVTTTIKTTDFQSMSQHCNIDYENSDNAQLLLDLFAHTMMHERTSVQLSCPGFRG